MTDDRKIVTREQWDDWERTMWDDLEPAPKHTDSDYWRVYTEWQTELRVRATLEARIKELEDSAPRTDDYPSFLLWINRFQMRHYPEQYKQMKEASDERA